MIVFSQFYSQFRMFETTTRHFIFTYYVGVMDEWESFKTYSLLCTKKCEGINVWLFLRQVREYSTSKYVISFSKANNIFAIWQRTYLLKS